MDFFKISTWLRMPTKKFTCQVNKTCSVCHQSVRACQHGFLLCHTFLSCPVSLMCLSSDPSSDLLPILVILKVAQPPCGCISGRLNAERKKFYNFLSYPQCFRGVLWYPYLRLRLKILMLLPITWWFSEGFFEALHRRWLLCIILLV